MDQAEGLREFVAMQAENEATCFVGEEMICVKSTETTESIRERIDGIEAISLASVD